MNERLLKIRSYLIELARNDETIFYSELSEILNLGYTFENGSSDGLKFGKELECISKYEIKRDRPLLTIIIVGKIKDSTYNEHLPSKKFYSNTKRFKKYKEYFNQNTRLKIYKDQKIILYNYWSNEKYYSSYKDVK